MVNVLMCLAIGSSHQRSNHLLVKVWRQVALTPLRLFSFGALFHLFIGVGIQLYSNVTNTQINTNDLLFGFTYGLLALMVFGFLMTWLPKKYSLSPVHYGRYNSVYLFIMASLIMIEYGSLFSQSWVELGMWLLIPGWLIALQGLWNLHVWIRSDMEIISLTLLILLFFNGTMAVISVLFMSMNMLMPEMMPLISMLLVWPLILLVSTLLIIKAPRSGRVIAR